MESDCCAVCAEPLEWIAYGPCGHREVCFTCIARLRFVLNDKSCCICKQECPKVYIAKALGAYTRVVADWNSLLQNNDNCSRQSNNLWYDNALDAYFDDESPFKIIKAMCRLYCSICERATEGEAEALAKGMMKKGDTFHNIDALRRHHSTVHKVFMCELCLEGRKVFTSEQKLYSKSQLHQHSRRGDSELMHPDGEEQLGGFAGHPWCHFCRKAFYSDNELYQHMSRDHYTCHICQRARPGQYEYYQNYDHLEAHFRQRHALCENQECLAKKFVVFPNESELRRHDATAHGEHMSRSQRNAACQIPVSFNYPRRPGQDSRRGGRGQGGRGQGSHPHTRDDHSGAELVRVNGESENLESSIIPAESPIISPRPSPEETITMDTLQGAAVERPETDHLEGATSQVQGDVDTESRYRVAVVGSIPSAPGSAAFPPLSGSSKSGEGKLINQGPAFVPALLGSWSASTGCAQSGTRKLNTANNRSSTVPSDKQTAKAQNERAGEAHSKIALITTQPVAIERVANREGAVNSTNGKPSRELEVGIVTKQQSNQHEHLSIEDIRAGNKALVQRIRAGLDSNEQQFADFKCVSSLYRTGEMSSKDYHGHIVRLGLSNVVSELARLCPDPRKGKELMDLHDAAELTNYRIQKGKFKVTNSEGSSSSASADMIMPSSGNVANELAPAREAKGGVDSLVLNERKNKKTSKFQRLRLGDASASAFFNSTSSLVPTEVENESENSSLCRGVWKNGGGQRLVSVARNGAS
ncbi:unnamed protein product [Calypogeia fissa]